MRARSSLALVVFLLAASGCSLSEAEDGYADVEWVDFSKFAQDTTALAGTWEWRRTTCCFDDVGVATPASTGQTGTLVFTTDDTVSVYWDGHLERQQTYAEHLGNAQWGVRAGLFAVSTAAMDGPESVYQRKE